MKIIDLTWDDLRENSCKIAEWFFLNKYYDCKVLVVGIANGGTFIGKEIKKKLIELGCDANYIDIICRRPSSKIKKNNTFLKHIIQHIPPTINNWLRILELKLIRCRENSSCNNNRIIKIENIQNFTELLKKAGSVLIVDDSIDSGASMKAVFEFISKHFDKDVTLTSLTVTICDPVIMPHFSVYKKTILRCPWALDFKK